MRTQDGCALQGRWSVSLQSSQNSAWHAGMSKPACCTDRRTGCSGVPGSGGGVGETDAMSKARKAHLESESPARSLRHRRLSGLATKQLLPNASSIAPILTTGLSLANSSGVGSRLSSITVAFSSEVSAERGERRLGELALQSDHARTRSIEMRR